MRTEIVWREFCNAYARITGTEPRNKRRNSASHLLAGVVPSSSSSQVSPTSGDWGRSEDCSFGGLEVGEVFAEDWQTFGSHDDLESFWSLIVYSQFVEYQQIYRKKQMKNKFTTGPFHESEDKI